MPKAQKIFSIKILEETISKSKERDSYPDTRGIWNTKQNQKRNTPCSIVVKAQKTQKKKKESVFKAVRKAELHVKVVL